MTSALEIWRRSWPGRVVITHVARGGITLVETASGAKRREAYFTSEAAAIEALAVDHIGWRARPDPRFTEQRYMGKVRPQAQPKPVRERAGLPGARARGTAP